MTASIVKRLALISAGPAMALRGGIVALNFGIMLGVAALLGLEVFGRLAVIWGLALVVSSIIAAGAPLLLLRALSDGNRLRSSAVLWHVAIYPVALGLTGLMIMPFLVGGLPWIAIFLAAFGIHLTACLASIMRALGSQHGSMVLRDAGPQLALGFAAILATDSAEILQMAGGVSCILCIGPVLWCWRHAGLAQIIHPTGRSARLPLGLWGTSVSGMALSQVDIILGGAVLSDGQTGLYALLRRITNLVALPVSVATWVTSVPVAATYGRGDQSGLARASADGSRIALIPGLVLCVGALACLAAVQIPALRIWAPQGDMVFVILLAGVVVQIVFAATFTIATLCGMAHFSALSRLFSIVAYLCLVAVTPEFSILYNALAYVVAVTLGSIALWAAVLRCVGVETSAFALIHSHKPGWRAS